MQNTAPQPPLEKTQPKDAPAGAGGSGKPAAPKPVKRSFLSKMFDPETRLGRFMRSLTRTLALIVGVFALGMLSVYLLLYQPLTKRSAADQASLAQLRQQVSQLEKDVSQAKSDAARLQQANQDLNASMDQSKGKQALLIAQFGVSQARYSLVTKDSATATQALKSVSTALDELAPIAGSPNATLIADLRSRLALAQGEMDRDALTAASDLGILSVQLSNLGEKMFEK